MRATTIFLAGMLGLLPCATYAVRTQEECSSIKEVAKRGACFEEIVRESNSLRSTYLKFAERAAHELTEDFFDPSSVMFRNRVAFKANDARVPRLVLCGEFNAKNQYGGYVGFRRFTASLHQDGSLFATAERRTVDSRPGFGEMDEIVNDMVTRGCDLEAQKAADVLKLD